MRKNHQIIACSIKLYKECSMSFMNLCYVKYKILMDIPLFFIAMYKSCPNLGKKISHEKNAILILGLLFLLNFQTAYAQTFDYLKSATNTGSGITTDNSKAWTDLFSTTIDLGSNTTDTKYVMVTASINMRPDGASTAAREGNYNIYRSDDATDESGIIKRQIKFNTEANVESWGIETLVHIFDVTGLSGSKTYTLEHSNQGGSDIGRNVYSSARLTAVALSTATNHYELSNDVIRVGDAGSTTTSTTYAAVANLTTDAITLPIEGDIYVAASVNGKATINVETVAEYKLEYSTDNGSNWADLGKPIKRSMINSWDDGIVSLVGLLQGQAADNDFKFRVAHKRVSGTGTVTTHNCNLVAVALAHSNGGSFPAFYSEVGATGVDITGLSTPATTVTSTTFTAATDIISTGTNLFVNSQYLVSASDLDGTDRMRAGNQLKVSGASSGAAEEYYRYIPDNANFGAGGFIGLMEDLVSNGSYTIAMDHQIATISGTGGSGDETLNTSEVILTGFQTYDQYPAITKTVGNTGADFFTLKQAFDSINANAGSVYTGAITLQIIANTTETASAVLTTANTNWTSVNIYPTNSGLIISGNLAAPLIDLDGSDNVTIDGRVNASGSAKDLTIVNTSSSSTAGTSTIRFINTAQNDTVAFCNVKGSSMATTSGIVYFATATAGTGNSFNGINNCNITNNASNRPINAIYSLGSETFLNTTNTISNNYVYDFLNKDASSNGISLFSYSTDFTISSNSFYETTALSPSGAWTYNAIRIYNYPSGVNFNITENYIGGSEALCGGSSFTINSSNSHLFQGIFLRAGITTASSIQNNTIKNISYTTTSSTPWTGIYIQAAEVNIGTILGNNIGETTGTNSITITNTTTAATSYGIYVSSPFTVEISKNNIGSINVIGSSSNSHSIIAIRKSSGGAFTVSHNNIGSETTANSIQASSPAGASSVQIVTGVLSYGSGNTTISNNIIYNLHNAYTGGSTNSRVRGIDVIFGSNIIQNNIIRNLSSSSGQQYYNSSASVIGISQSSTTASVTQTINDNTIYNLYNTHPTAKVDVYGIYFGGSTTGNNEISNNFIYGLSVSSSNTASAIKGIITYIGASTIFNNIINFGGNVTSGTAMFGLFDQSGSGNNNNFYFNTVYIGGITSGTTANTYAFYNHANTSTRNHRNNVFYNDRTGGTTGKHYAIYLAGSTNLTNDYNNYYVSPTGILGKIGSTNYTALDASWETASGGDANSVNINPVFMIGGSTAPVDYMPATTLAGLPGLGITVDMRGISRAATPTMGAIERGPFWNGTTSTDFNTASNWSNNIVPSSGTNLFFADNPDRSCYLDMDRTIGAIVINQPTDKLVANGYDLTINGTLALSNGGQIDASTSSSTVILGSASSQSIPSGAFYNNEVYNLTINNSNNVQLSGTLRLLNTISSSSGRLDATTNSSTFVYAGTSAQTIESNIFLNEKFYNLTIDNSIGVTLNADFTIDNNLLINSGKLFTVSAAKNLEVVGVITNSAGNSGFVLNSDATGTAELLHNTTDVPATIKRYISGAAESWHFISSPVSAQSISGSWLPSGTYGNETGYDLYLWNESNSCWFYKLNTTSTINWNTVHSGSDFEVGRGYLYSVQETTPTKEFAGNLNSGTLNIPLSYASDTLRLKGFNLIGNSYPSSIDWKASNGWTRTNLASSGEGYNIWIWNPAANNYGVYNSADIDDTGTNSASRYIAPAQGFFVQADNTGNLSMSNSVRVLEGTNNWFKSVSTDVDKLSVSINSDAGLGFDEISLNFGYYENEVGALKLFSTVSNAPSLYIPYSSDNFCVLNLTNTDENPVVPISFISGASGDYTIVCNFDSDRFDIVMLEDCKTHYIQNMKARQTYNFRAEKSDSKNRFKLHFGAIDGDYGEELPARIYSDGPHLIIDLSLVTNETTVTVCDIMGRILLQGNYIGETQHNIPLNINNQILIVHLKNPSGSICKKIFLKKY